MTPEDNLMRQAWKTADEYLSHAIECIDIRLGEAYAAKHPELIGVFMRTAAHDYATGILHNDMERLVGRIDDAIERLNPSNL